MRAHGAVTHVAAGRIGPMPPATTNGPGRNTAKLQPTIMSSQRIARVNEMMRREVGNAILRLDGEEGFDVAAVTVTSVDTSPNLRQARVNISILEHHDDREAMMRVLKRHRADIQHQISRHLVLKYTPKLMFVFDSGIEKGAHVLDLLNELTGAEPDEPDTPDPGLDGHVSPQDEEPRPPV